MRVGFFIDYQPSTRGGGVTYQDSLVKELINFKGKHEFYFFYYGERVHVETESARFIPIRETTEPGNGTPVLLTLLLKHKIDMCWFLTPYFQFVHVPYICTVWDLEHRKQPFFPEVSQTGWTWDDREANYRNLLPRATYVITGTEKGKEEIKEFYGVLNERIRVIPFSTPDWVLEYKDRQIDTPLNDIPGTFLFYPAQFWPHKNHIVLLYALKILVERYSHNFYLVFTGSDMGNLQHVKEEAIRLGLEKRVIFKGFVDRGTLVSLYRNAFALVYPSFFGPDNLPPLEAFAFGCPVLVASILGSHEHLREAAMLFDPTSEDEIAEKIHMLSLDENLRKSLIEKGHGFSKKRETKDCVREIITLLDDFEIYRRTWSLETLYRNLNPESGDYAANIQCTIDEIYSMMMSYQKMEQQLKESEADREARLEVINRLDEQLRQSLADGEERLEVINRLDEQLRQSLADGEERLGLINRLKELLKKFSNKGV